MNLQIRDPRAHELARRLAQRRRVSMTEAVIDALEAELQRAPMRASRADRLGAIADDLTAPAKPDGHDMNQSEVDEMAGHL